jgi:exodeoxyribonuclease V alpha subunit
LATVANGDPIVITANRYHHGLFNGQMGVVTGIGGECVEVLLDAEREPGELSAEAQADVELAYCVTCHKAQGSSANTAMIIVENSQSCRGNGYIRGLRAADIWFCSLRKNPALSSRRHSE